MKKDLLILGENEVSLYIEKNLVQLGYNCKRPKSIEESSVAISSDTVILDLWNLCKSETEEDKLLFHNSTEIQRIIDFASLRKIPIVLAYKLSDNTEETTSAEIALQLIKKTRKFKNFIYTAVEIADVYGPDIITSDILQTYLDDIVHGTTLYVQDDLKTVNLINQKDLIIGLDKILSTNDFKPSYSLINEENLTQIEFAHFLDDLTELSLVIEYDGEAAEELTKISIESEVTYPQDWSPDTSLEEGLIEIYKTKDIPLLHGADQEKQEEDIILTQEMLQKRVESLPEDQDSKEEVFSIIPESEDHINTVAHSQNDEEDLLFKESHAYEEDSDDETYAPVYANANLDAMSTSGITPESINKEDTIIKETLPYEPSKQKQTGRNTANNPYLFSTPPIVKPKNKIRKKVAVALAVLFLVLLTIPSLVYSYNLSNGMKHLSKGTAALNSFDYDKVQSENKLSYDYFEKLSKTPIPITLVVKLFGLTETDFNYAINIAKKTSEAEMALVNESTIIASFDQNTNQKILGASTDNSYSANLENATEASAMIQNLLQNENYTNNKLLQPLVYALKGFPSPEELLKIKRIQSALPIFLGYTSPQKYLVLIQNSEQMRASGGKVALYQVITIQNGVVNVDSQGDISNLDNKLVENYKLNPPPPLPVRKALDENKLLFSNANWEPDFSKNAKTMLDLYQKAENQTLAGIIALSPEHLSLINSLANTSVTSGNLKSLFTALNSKKVLAYHSDNSVQQALMANNWSGDVVSDADDILYVIDSNLSGENLDHKVERAIDITSYQPNKGNGFLRNLKLTYKNNNESKSGENGTYINHLRVVVPKNAFLNSAKIITSSEEKNITRKVDVAPYGNKAIYSTDLSVGPNETIAIVFEYESTNTFIGEDEFDFDIFKQPNSGDYPITYKFVYSENIPENQKILSNFKQGDKEISVNDVFNEDKHYKIPL